MGGPGTGRAGGLDDPCATLRRDVEEACREVERLAIAAAAEAARLRDARASRSALDGPPGSDPRLADPDHVERLKDEANRRYREAVRRARDAGGVADAAGAWLRTIDDLNRAARRAVRPPADAAARRAQLDAAVERLAVTVDAARVASSAADERCRAARAQLAVCEESAHGAGQVPAGWGVRGSTISRLLAGDAAVLDRVSRAVASALGRNAADAELLLTELCEQVRQRALEEAVLAFPPAHPFWGQFPAADARLVASALTGLGNGFDGRSGWSAGQPADGRAIATALAYAGYDPRALRHVPAAGELQLLWSGTAVDVESFLEARSPSLALDELSRVLGSRGRRLDLLWDHWGRIRPLLVQPADGALPAA